MFSRRPRCILNVLCMFHLRHVFKGVFRGLMISTTNYCKEYIGNKHQYALAAEPNCYIIRFCNYICLKTYMFQNLQLVVVNAFGKKPYGNCHWFKII